MSCLGTRRIKISTSSLKAKRVHSNTLPGNCEQLLDLQDFYPGERPLPKTTEKENLSLE